MHRHWSVRYKFPFDRQVISLELESQNCEFVDYEFRKSDDGEGEILAPPDVLQAFEAMKEGG